jgi:tripartite-type tricarboxylate transporter receptor subunit TctC
MNRLVIRAFVALSLAAATLVATAQTFPSKPIRIIAPYAPGSGPEVFARFLAERLTKSLKQPVTIENRPGGNGFIAIGAVKRAAPDGHELLLVANSHLTINPTLIPNAPYDVDRDFTPLSLLYRTPFYVAVAANSPYRNMTDLVNAAKARPGEINYGTPYVGSNAHLGSIMLESLTDTRMTHVPYKDVPQIYIGLSNGDLDWAYTTIGSAGSLLRSGKIRLIAIASEKRAPSQPNVPTVKEAGGPAQLEVEAWVALMAPKATPPETVRRITAELATVLADPQVQAFGQTLGFDAVSSTPEQLRALMVRDTALYAEQIKRRGLKAE